jgi:4-amino-4-deoxy-L-arabinose transferase-like glycosyltransferase
MSLILSDKQMTKARETTRHKIQTMLSSWLRAWEIYPIILIAGFLRLYRLDTTAFSYDQSMLFRMAYDAVHYGLIPATSNGSSILTLHPPLTVYLLMLPALFSANPLWAAVMTALFNVVAVLLTYIFTRRYFGRLAATIAALLYATAQTTIIFSRFIWQPTLLAPFTILFLFALFWGVVERRKGWLFPALVLLGVMYQLHELTFLLAAPLVVALVLAPRTIRPRDLVLALVFLLLIFAPYLVWEVNTRFADIHTALGLARAHAQIDSKAVTFYQRFLNSYYYDERFLGSSYYDPTGSASSLVFKFLPILTWSRQILVFLLLGGFATAGVFVSGLWSPTNASGPTRGRGPTAGRGQAVAPTMLRRSQAPIPGRGPTAGQGQAVAPTMLRRSQIPFARIYEWWIGLRADPVRCGFVVLLVWQIVPVLLLLRHSAPVHQHYLLLVIPGPFILVGFCIARVISWFHGRQPERLWRGMGYAMYAVTALLLSVQLLGSTASLVDTVNGINSHIFGYNQLGYLQHALQEADQLAQQRHLNRVYVTMSTYDDTLSAMPFLAGQLRTPTTLFDAASCLVLPAPGASPAVLLVRSTDKVVTALLTHFATVTLVDQPPLLGASPFQLYIVTSGSANMRGVQPNPAGNGFVNHLQLFAPRAQQLRLGTSPFLVTRWTLLHSEQPRLRSAYTYIMRAKADLPNSGSIRSDCTLTSIRAGDQLITAFRLPQGSPLPSSFRITSQFLMTSPYTISLGPLHFETANTQGAPVALRAVHGSDAITISSL